MTTARLYCPSIVLGIVELSPVESHHALDVLRVRGGEQVVLFDGVGAEGTGSIVAVGKGPVRVDVQRIDRVPFDARVRVTLAVAMPKTHRQGYLVEKCTELGVAALWPILTSRSVTKPSPAAIDKWQRRAIEAAKQCKRAWVPTIESAQTLERALERSNEFDAAAMADASGEAQPLHAFLKRIRAASRLIVWIGPEGGWTDAERQAAIDAGISPVGLGPAILRTETAAVAISAAVRLMDPCDSNEFSAKDGSQEG